jgi:hypothetical protein
LFRAARRTARNPSSQIHSHTREFFLARDYLRQCDGYDSGLRFGASPARPVQ